MNFVSFDIFRTLDIPGVKALKPENMFREKDLIRSADWVLFPEYWQLNTLVYGFGKKIFPSFSSYQIGNSKIETTRVLESICPENIPYTKILPSGESAIESITDEFTFPLVAKEPRSSMGIGVRLVNSREELLEYAAKKDVLYVQEYLPIKRDLRIVVIGKKVIAAYWREAAEGEFRNNVARGGKISFEDVPDEAVAMAGNIAVKLGIDYAGFDVAVHEGRFYIFEINIKFGLDGLNMLNIKTGKLILDYLNETV